jgi:hypothetical protein
MVKRRVEVAVGLFGGFVRLSLSVSVCLAQRRGRSPNEAVGGKWIICSVKC